MLVVVIGLWVLGARTVCAHWLKRQDIITLNKMNLPLQALFKHISAVLPLPAKLLLLLLLHLPSSTGIQ